ncbi:PaREP1/PaREP8 domain containing family protein [Ignisphaera aggregans DSM 17230]|uniref:PaREP1/PaREP8 domain containing family protein n=1 Tax=Ignisphaera aggregans (strain DSM 17230 / JCM 13409 / AQ1.S1) TaxID=583356 RepID=E0STN7_IGNAA|nr:PaREP1/PaREP8 domain containing family protein [Ignisphaera aggregans DSM 17230]
MAIAIRLPKKIVERLENEATKLGLTLEEYLVELISGHLDPISRAYEYIEVAKDLLEQAGEELSEGNIRQAAEKIWGSATLAVKAYADFSEDRRLRSHGELWEYTKTLMKIFGDWVYDSWMAANGMHTCFYEGWCTAEHVEEALKRVKRLVEEIMKIITKQ